MKATNGIVRRRRVFQNCWVVGRIWSQAVSFCSNAAMLLPAGHTAPQSADCASRWSQGIILSCRPSRTGRPRGWPTSVVRLTAPALWTMSRSRSCGGWEYPRHLPTMGTSGRLDLRRCFETLRQEICISLLDTDCGFQIELKSIIANGEIGETLAEQGERQMDNDGENPL